MQVFTRDGAHVRSYGRYGAARAKGVHVAPRSVAVTRDGTSYVARSHPLEWPGS